MNGRYVLFWALIACWVLSTCTATRNTEWYSFVDYIFLRNHLRGGFYRCLNDYDLIRFLALRSCLAICDVWCHSVRNARVRIVRKYLTAPAHRHEESMRDFSWKMQAIPDLIHVDVVLIPVVVWVLHLYVICDRVKANYLTQNSVLRKSQLTTLNWRSHKNYMLYLTW